MNKTFKEYEEENTIICPNCNVKIKTNIIPMNFFDNIHEDMYISHEAEYLERKELQDRLDRIIKEINDYEEDYYEEPSVIVNKRDRKDKWSFEEYQETIYRIATGEDNED